MNAYSAICCFKSPRWHKALNPLVLEKYYNIETTRKDLPPECVDTYLGSLISLAVVFNKSISYLNADNFNAFLEVKNAMSKSLAITSKLYQVKLQVSIRSYLALGLPADFIRRHIEYGALTLATRQGKIMNLNEPLFYETLQKVAAIDYEYTQLWFQQHPCALLESKYIDKIEEGNSDA